MEREFMQGEGTTTCNGNPEWTSLLSPRFDAVHRIPLDVSLVVTPTFQLEQHCSLEDMQEQQPRRKRPASAAAAAMEQTAWQHAASAATDNPTCSQQQQLRLQHPAQISLAKPELQLAVTKPLPMPLALAAKCRLPQPSVGSTAVGSGTHLQPCLPQPA